MDKIPINPLYTLIHNLNRNFLPVKGKNEYETYINYPEKKKAVLEAHIINIFNSSEGKSLQNEKCDTKALQLRNEGNKYFGKDNRKAMDYFSRSLYVAEVNSEAYAIALANRSAVSFVLKDYSSCIQDIHLCLKSSYPDRLKPKVYIRKAKCCTRLNKPILLKIVLRDYESFLDTTSAIDSETIVKYRNEITEFQKNSDELPGYHIVVPTLELPFMNTNRNFLNASPFATLMYKKSLGRHVVAKIPLEVGDVIFIEKPYMFITLAEEHYICHCCYKARNCLIPCNQCTHMLFCTEDCRDYAWEEYHQWECSGVKARLYMMLSFGQLALRTIFKASKTGFVTISSGPEEDTISYGNKTDNYPYVHKLCCHLDKLANNIVADLCATASAFMCYIRTQTTFFNKLREDSNFSGCTDKEIENKLASIFIRHCCQFSSNIILMNVDEFHPHGDMFAIGIYPSVSMLNHSCDTNTAYYFVNDAIVVKATKRIDAGEQIFYNYKDNTIFSDKKLDEVFCFKCKCKFCSSNKYTEEAFDSFLCVNCKGPSTIDGNLPSQRNSCTCLECGFKFTLPASILANERSVPNYITRFEKHYMASNYPPTFDDDISKFNEILRVTYSPTHRLFYPFFMTAIDYYLTKEGALDVNNLMNMVHNSYNYSALRSGNTSKKYARTEFDVCQKIMDVILKQINQMPGKHCNFNDLLSFASNVLKEAVMLKLWYPTFSITFDRVLKRGNSLHRQV